MKDTDDRRIGVHPAYRNRLEDESGYSQSTILVRIPPPKKVIFWNPPFFGKFVNEGLQVLF